MTHEQAESELMQIYMSLSEGKKQAIDVLMAQADGEYILKKDVMCCIGQTSLHWELARKLRELPSVAIPSAEPKTGHWIYWHTNGFGRKIYKCSKCNWNGDMAGYNFCPKCGCRMVDEQKGAIRNDKRRSNKNYI